MVVLVVVCMRLAFSIGNVVAKQVRVDYEGFLIRYHFLHRLRVVVDPWREYGVEIWKT